MRCKELARVLPANIRIFLDIEIFDGYVDFERFEHYKQRLARADFIAITVMTQTEHRLTWAGVTYDAIVKLISSR